jgi:hypothetical protein
MIKLSGIVRQIHEDVSDISIDDLIKLIQTKQLPQSLLNKIESMISASDTQTEVFDFLTKTVKLSPKTSKYIISLAIEYRCYTVLKNISSNPETRISLEELGNSGNILDKISSLNLPAEFVKDIWTIKEPKSGVASGAGEVALQLLIRDGYSPAKGDLGVGNIEFEVKTTTKSLSKETGFRLRGQNGYGIGNKSGIYVFKKIADLAYDAKIKLPPEVSNTQAQLYLKASDSFANSFFRELVTKGVTLDQIAEIYADSLLLVYTRGDRSLMISILKDSLNADGSLDIETLLPKLAAFEMQYYSSIEQWDKFITINGTYDYVILDSGMSFSALETLMKNNFHISPPNTKKNATPQDSLCSLRFKK